MENMENLIKNLPGKIREEFLKQIELFESKMKQKPGLMEKYEENTKKIQEDENLRNQYLEEGAQRFKTSDVNNDGRLNLEEYMNYVNLSFKQNKERFGDWIEYTDDEKKDYFRILDELSPEPGVSQEDQRKGMMIYYILKNEKK